MTVEAPTRPGGLLHRHRSTLLIVGGLVLGVLVVVALGGGVRTTGYLDPGNPGPDGARALARVLDREGVDVQIVRSADALEETRPDASSTVLVTSIENTGPSTRQRLRASTGESLVVLADPGSVVTDELGAELGFAVSAPVTRSAECTGAALAPVLDGLEIAVDRGVEYPAPAGCFFGVHGALLAQPEEGLLLLGGSEILRNDGVLRADNAAVALRLLGQRERLVWYVPDFADLDSSEAVSLATLLPDWLRPGLWLTALAMVAVLLWRGRRLGPLVTEPLPVVVKAIETTRSRGRLYRKADDRAHAATALRTAARSALAEHLRLPAGAAPETLVRDVARHVGRPVAEIGGLLHPAAPLPVTDHDLITLATALAELDREVRRP